jgi:hypothetical protein
LSIQGFEAYTGSSGSTVIRSTTSTSTPSQRPKQIKTGGSGFGFGGTPSGASTKITLKNASMNRPYSAGSYKADWALQGGSKTSIAAKGVGNYWKA